MDFTLSPEIEDIRVRTRAFIEEHVLPLESDPANFSEHENIPLARLKPVQANAKSANVALNRARSQVYLPVESRNNPGFHYRFKSQEGGSPETGVWALRITSDMAGHSYTAGVKRRRIHDLEREFELLEEHARPARWHRAAVPIGQADPQLAQLHRFARRR